MLRKMERAVATTHTKRKLGYMSVIVIFCVSGVRPTVKGAGERPGKGQG